MQIRSGKRLLLKIALCKMAQKIPFRNAPSIGNGKFNISSYVEIGFLRKIRNFEFPSTKNYTLESIMKRRNLLMSRIMDSRSGMYVCNFVAFFYFLSALFSSIFKTKLHTWITLKENNVCCLVVSYLGTIFCGGTKTSFFIPWGTLGGRWCVSALALGHFFSCNPLGKTLYITSFSLEKSLQMNCNQGTLQKQLQNSSF